jgi:hypothetical protein
MLAAFIGGWELLLIAVILGGMASVGLVGAAVIFFVANRKKNDGGQSAAPPPIDAQRTGRTL